MNGHVGSCLHFTASCGWCVKNSDICSPGRLMASQRISDVANINDNKLIEIYNLNKIKPFISLVTLRWSL